MYVTFIMDYIDVSCRWPTQTIESSDER